MRYIAYLDLKTIALSLPILVISYIGQAQNIGVGLKAGASLTSSVGKDDRNNRSRLGYHGGGVMRVGFGKLSVQPEVLFSIKGDESLSYRPSIASQLTYIDVPLSIQFNWEEIFFEIGPQAGYLISVKPNDPSVEAVGKLPFRTLDYGYLIGFGYQDEGGFQVGWRYNGGLANVYKAVDFSGAQEQVSIRNGVLQFYVGYAFDNLLGGRTK